MWEINNRLNYITWNLYCSIVRLLLLATWKQFLKGHIFKSHNEKVIRYKNITLHKIFSAPVFVWSDFVREKHYQYKCIFIAGMKSSYLEKILNLPIFFEDWTIAFPFSFTLYIHIGHSKTCIPVKRFWQQIFVCYFSQASKNVLLLPINLYCLIIINLFSKLIECGKCSSCTIFKKAITVISWL